LQRKIQEFFFSCNEINLKNDFMKIINGGLIYFTFALGLLSFGGYKDEPVNNLSVSPDRIELNKVGSDTSMTIQTEYAPPVHISISQNGDLYPNYNSSPLPPDASGMSSNASELAAAIDLGWNLGNSLEAIGGETAWGNPRVTKAFINLVRQSGFNAVRIPCSWNQHMSSSSTAQLSTDWLNRVKEVIQYCVDNDMYVLLNIHWDGGWLENNCTVARQEENNARQKAFWEQIATHLRDFDEHLLFAGANEPNVENAGQMAVLKSYHQTFINAVRSTGGRNSYRVLVIQGPSTDIDKTCELMTSLPVDSVSNRLMAEIHYYTPWNFCGMTEDANWGNMFYYWGNGNHSATDLAHNPTWGEEDAVNSLFQKMKNLFVNKGIPVILGEYAPVRRSALTGEALTRHQQSRAYYLKYVTMKAKENGIIPFYWDNGGTGNNACGIFNRNTNTVSDQQALDALVEGAAN
jgi:aryl-phospho-beta-D-glucosidase BglC (GH1 family)